MLVDGADRALLLRGGDPARPSLRWWFTPGGGLDDGETSAEGAVRELFEETGLRIAPDELGDPIWHQVTEFSYDNRRYRQDQDFYLVRVTEWQVDTAGFDAEERLTIDAHRWWSAAELEATDEMVFPVELASLLREWTGSAGPAGASTDPGRGLATEYGRRPSTDSGRGLASESGRGLPTDSGRGLAADPGRGLVSESGRGLPTVPGKGL